MNVFRFLGQAPGAGFRTGKIDRKGDDVAAKTATEGTSSEQTAALASVTETLRFVVNDSSIPEDHKIRLIVHGTSLACGILAAQPLPFADIVILTPIQVAAVGAMNQVMGRPIGEHGLPEILSTVAGVVGGGMIAQHVILGLYKTVLPFWGAVTTIPLVYAATYGILSAARAILESKREGIELSKREINAIRQDYEKRAKAERGNLTFQGARKEWDDLRRRAADAERFEQELKDADRVRRKDADTVDRLELTIKEMSVSIIDSDKKVQELNVQIEERVRSSDYLEILDERDTLQEQSTNQNQELVRARQELEAARSLLDSRNQKREESIKVTFQRKFRSLHFAKQVIKALADLSIEVLTDAEREFGKLEHDLKNVRFREDSFRDAGRRLVQEIDIHHDWRIYLTVESNQVVIRRIGHKNTQERDTAQLRADAQET